MKLKSIGVVLLCKTPFV